MNKTNPGIGFVIITLPIPGFVSVVSLAVFRLTGDGVQITPALLPGLIDLALFLLGKLLVGDEFLHNTTSQLVVLLCQLNQYSRGKVKDKGNNEKSNPM